MIGGSSDQDDPEALCDPPVEQYLIAADACASVRRSLGGDLIPLLTFVLDPSWRVSVFSERKMMPSSEVVSLVGDMAWPITTLLILWILRRELKAIFQALRERVADPHTPVKLTSQGIELGGRIDILEGAVETQQLKIGVLASAAATTTRKESGSAEEISQALLTLRDEYLAADAEPDHERRIQIRNDIARSMGAEVLRTNMNRRVLAERNDEVITLALAAAVTALPQPGDDALILSAGRGIARLHVRYRIAAAIAELAESWNLQPNLIADAKDLLDSYRKSADDRLIRRIDWTLTVLKNYASGRVA